MHTDKNTLKTLALAGLCGASGAWAQALPVEVPSAIESVTVYPGVAVVDRVAKIPGQARQVILNCLSTSFDMSALRVQADPSVQIGAISATDLPRQEVAACNTTPLDAPIAALEQKIAASQAAQASQALVLDYLKNIGTNPTTPPTQRDWPAHLHRCNAATWRRACTMPVWDAKKKPWNTNSSCYSANGHGSKRPNLCVN